VTSAYDGRVTLNAPPLPFRLRVRPIYEEIFKDEAADPAAQRTAATAADDLLIAGRESRFYPHDLVTRAACRTIKACDRLIWHQGEL
jgi:hypothetical protein